jgi:hypothetical protein
MPKDQVYLKPLILRVLRHIFLNSALALSFKLSYAILINDTVASHFSQLQIDYALLAVTLGKNLHPSCNREVVLCSKRDYLYLRASSNLTNTLIILKK